MKLLTGLGMALWLLGCGIGNGAIAVETRDLGSIDALEATQGVRVTVQYGEPASITIETDENLLSMVETRQIDGRLHIGITHDQWAFATDGVNVTVVTPRLDAIEATSSAVVRVEGAKQPALRVEATSSARVELIGLQVDQLVAEATSSAVLIAKGRADRFEASSTSTATVAAAELEAREVKLEATSWSRVSVRATALISGEVDSGASVTVYGHPANHLDVASGGVVRYGE